MFHAVFIPSSKTLLGQSSFRRNPYGFLFRDWKPVLSSATLRNSSFGIAILLWGTRSYLICSLRAQRRAVDMRGRGTLLSGGGAHVMVLCAAVFCAAVVRTDMVRNSQPSRTTDRTRSAGQATFQEAKRSEFLQKIIILAPSMTCALGSTMV